LLRKQAQYFSALALAGALLFSGSALTAAQAAEVNTESSQRALLAPRALLLDAQMSGQLMVAVGERGHVLLSDDGKIWSQVIVPTRNLLTALTGQDHLLLAAGHNATILRSIDQGRSWQLVYDQSKLAADDSAQGSPLLDINCTADAQRCFAAGAYGLLLESADGGQSWVRLTVNQEDRNFYAVLVEDKIITLAGEAGALLRSTDGGLSWSELHSPYEGSFFGLLRTAQHSLIAYGLRGNIWRSVDDGASWTRIDSHADTGLMGGTVTIDGRIIIVGASGTVLISQDDGQSFTLARQANRKALSAVLPLADGSLIGFGEAGAAALEIPNAAQ